MAVKLLEVMILQMVMMILLMIMATEPMLQALLPQAMMFIQELLRMQI